MHSRKAVPIIDLMNAANMELIRLDFKSSTLSRHSKEFRDFSNYCRENEITAYDTETGPQYFQHRYGLDIGDSTTKLTKQQLDTRCSIRFLDDLFQFGYALRYGSGSSANQKRLLLHGAELEGRGRQEENEMAVHRYSGCWKEKSKGGGNHAFRNPAQL